MSTNRSIQALIEYVEHFEGRKSLLSISASAELARLQRIEQERDALRDAVVFLKACIGGEDIPFCTETCAVLKKHIERAAALREAE